ncbi:MAG: hypothetical protein P4K83_08145 [Terracidiphilus sp.]|nr:hypothetical protein [Terracidiphilus sp.]
MNFLIRFFDGGRCRRGRPCLKLQKERATGFGGKGFHVLFFVFAAGGAELPLGLPLPGLPPTWAEVGALEGDEMEKVTPSDKSDTIMYRWEMEG